MNDNVFTVFGMKLNEERLAVKGMKLKQGLHGDFLLQVFSCFSGTEFHSVLGLLCEIVNEGMEFLRFSGDGDFQHAKPPSCLKILYCDTSIQLEKIYVKYVFSVAMPSVFKTSRETESAISIQCLRLSKNVQVSTR